MGFLYSWSLKSSGGDVWKERFYVIKCNCDDNSSVGYYKSLKWRPDLVLELLRESRKISLKNVILHPDTVMKGERIR